MATILYGVFTPLWFPFLGFEDTREGTCHLDGPANRKVRGCFLVEQSKNFIIEVDRSAGKLYRADGVVFHHGYGGHMLSEFIFVLCKFFDGYG